MRFTRCVLTASVLALAACGGGGDDFESQTGPSPTGSSQSACSVPSAPTGLVGSVVGTSASLAWNGSAGAADYLVIVGTSPSSSNTLLTNTTATRYEWSGLRSGRHYARVEARNACGASRSSNEIELQVAE